MPCPNTQIDRQNKKEKTFSMSFKLTTFGSDHFRQDATGPVIALRMKLDKVDYTRHI